METKNCIHCGKMFTYIGGPPLCQACIKKMDEKFDEVKQYVYEHPGCGVQEVCDECDVNQQQIRRWVKEERLCFSESSDVAFNCEKCGKRILTGRFCPACKKDMTNQLGNLYKKDEPEVKVEKKGVDNKMRFINN